MEPRGPLWFSRGRRSNPLASFRISRTILRPVSFHHTRPPPHQRSTAFGSVKPYYASLCLTSARKTAPRPSTFPEASFTPLQRLEVRIEAFHSRCLVDREATSWINCCRSSLGSATTENLPYSAPADVAYAQLSKILCAWSEPRLG